MCEELASGRITSANATATAEFRAYAVVGHKSFRGFLISKRSASVYDAGTCASGFRNFWVPRTDAGYTAVHDHEVLLARGTRHVDQADVLAERPERRRCFIPQKETP